MLLSREPCIKRSRNSSFACYLFLPLQLNSSWPSASPAGMCSAPCVGFMHHHQECECILNIWMFKCLLALAHQPSWSHTPQAHICLCIFTSRPGAFKIYLLTFGERRKMSIKRLKFKMKALGQRNINMQLSGGLTFWVTKIHFWFVRRVNFFHYKLLKPHDLSWR